MIRARIALFVLLITGAAALAGEHLFDALWQRPQARGVVIVPDTYLRRWDPVTVFFPSARGRPGPEDRPESYVTVSPPHPGAYTWIDAHTLQFKPADPWPALGSYTWTAGTAKTTLATLLAPPADTEPTDGETDLAPVDRIELSFDDPTPPAVLARMISIELRPLPGVVGAPQHLTAADFTVKQAARNTGRYRYVVRLKRAIPRGTRASVRLGLAAADVGADDQAVTTITFATAPPFRVVSLGCPDAQLPVTSAGTRYPADQPLRCTDQMVELAFSAEVADFGPVQGRDLIRFDPAVRNLRFERTGGRHVRVLGDFVPDRAYRVSVVPAPIFDADQRPLDIEGESAVWLSFAPQARVLRWDDARGLAERRGPKRVPMRARGHAKADLRIYRIDPLSRSFWPFRSVMRVDESLRPPGPGELPAAWDKPGLIDPSTLRQQLTALGAPGVSTLIDVPDDDAERRGLDLAPHLTALAGKTAPGHYLIGLRALDDDTRQWMRLQVTDLSLTSVAEAEATRFYVTSLATAKPIAGAEVVIEGPSGTGDARQWTRLWRGRTGVDGSVTWAAPGPQRTAPQVQRIVIKKGDDVLVLDPQSPPDAFADGYWSRNGAWLGWMLADGDRGEQPRVRAHLFPERPIYRPAHVVHLKAWARMAHQGTFEAVSGEATIVVRGPSGVKWRLPVKLSDHGTAYAAFDEADKPTGIYTAWLERVDADGTRRTLAETHFTVEAYRLPTFKVGLLGPRTVPLDAPFDVAALGTYYAGGRVSERPVRWRVTQYPYSWTPKGPAGFVYSVDGRYTRQRRFEATPRFNRTGLTDLDGRAGLTLDPTIEPTAQPRTYVVEATITGADDQTVTATRRVRAVPGFALGLKLPRYVEPGANGRRIQGQVIAVDAEGKPVVGQPLTVVLKHRQWHAHLKAANFSEGEAKYVTDTVDVEVRQLKLTSAAEPVALDLPVPRAGVYLVEITSQDRLGRAQTVVQDLYVGGDEPVSWPKPENKTFTATPDKGEYVPGGTAKVVIQSPFQTARALVVIEAPDRNIYRWVPVRGGKAVVSITLERTYTPTLPVHVMLLRGRTRTGQPLGQSAVDLGRPEAVASTVELTIKPVAHTLDVAVENPPNALPGQTVPLTVRLADHTGKPMAGEVTLWLVDQAVLDLGEELPLNPINAFVHARGSRVLMRDTRRLVFGRIPFAVMPGGDGGDDEDDDPLAKATVRRDFRPVPYYEPALQIGRDGVAQVQVKLPDNLTRFAIRAKAIGQDRFGFAKGHIDVRLPVVAQPALPRFVRAGDSFSAGIVGRIVEGPKGAGTAQITVVGGMANTDKAGVEFGRTGTARADFDVRVDAPAGQSLVVTSAIRRDSDGAADAAEVTLPIRPDRAERVTRRVVRLDGEARLPAVADGARPGTLQRRVTLATHPAIARAAGAVDSLRARPDGATDGRLARARVFLAAGALRTMLGLSDDDAAIAGLVRDTLAWLHQCVDGKGRIGPFPGTRGQVPLTAEAMLFLVEAKEAGHSVSPRLMTRLKETLRQALRSDFPFLDGASWTARTRALEALATAGALDASYLNEFVSRGQGLGAPHAARVLLAAQSGDKIDAVGAALGQSLHDAVRVRLKDGEPTYAGLTGFSLGNPLIGASEAAAMAVVHRALAISPLQSDRLPLLESALLALGDDGGWGGPRADAEALFAVADLLERGTGDTVQIAAGGQSATLTPGNALTTVTLATADAVPLKATGGAATAVEIVRAVPTPPGSAEPAAAQGFVVKRDLAKVPSDGPLQRMPIDAPAQMIPLQVGDVIEEHVQITNPETRHYVAITLPLAAGVEPLNPALKTAPPEAKTQQRETRAPDYMRMLDDRVVWYFVRLPKGTYDLYVRTRATVAGRFSQPAARAEALLTPAVRGNSHGARVEVRRK